MRHSQRYFPLNSETLIPLAVDGVYREAVTQGSAAPTCAHVLADTTDGFSAPKRAGHLDTARAAGLATQ